MSVNIVLISHSYELVFGLQKILEQVQPDVKIAIAGGTEENDIGTSAIKIKDAIESVCTEDGVAVLFDLGSALINAELALDLMEITDKVRFCNAPLVEGAYAATVEAGCGSSLDEVVDASEQAKQLNKLF